MLMVLNVSITCFTVNSFSFAAEPIVICTQCKFSDPDATTKLDKATVAKTRDLTIDQFRPYFAKGMILSFNSIN